MFRTKDTFTRNAAVSALTAVVAALAGLGATVAPASAAGGVGSAGVPRATAPFDRQFIDVVAAHHQLGIDMATMALQSTRHPRLKTIARGIVSRERNELAQLHALRARLFGSRAFGRYSPSDAQARQLGMSGLMAVHEMMDSPHFDHVFLSEMITHHRGAIVLASWELASGTNGSLKAMAAAMIPTQVAEIATMAAARSVWYGS